MLKDWNYWKNRITGIRDWLWSETLKMVEHELTPIERIAFLAIYDLQLQYGMNNFSFSCQEQIGKYRVDFLIRYQPLDNPAIDRKIIIECDGHDYHERTKEQAAHDKQRDRFFTKRGYIVLRYTGSELCRDPYKIMQDVDAILIPENFRESFGIGNDD
jgi:very-short-patch-repair endonuclease